MMTPEQAGAWLRNLGGRRFVMTMGAGFVHALLLVGKYLDQATYMALTMATVGVFVGANTYQKVKELTSP